MTSSPQWQAVTPKLPAAQARVIASLLEAQGFTVYLAQEGAGSALGLTIGPLGSAQVFVPDTQAAEAQHLVDAYFRGDLHRPDAHG